MLSIYRKPKSTKQNKKTEHPYSKSASALTQMHSASNLDAIQRSTSLPSTQLSSKQRSQSNASNHSNESNTSNTSRAKPLSNGEIQEIPNEMKQYIDESYSNTPIHLGNVQDIEWSPLYSDEFWAKPPKVFHETFSEEFVRRMHEDRESKDLIISEWTIDDDEKIPSDQPTAYIRKIEFITKIKDAPPFMPSHTECYQTQRFRFYGRNMAVIDNTISTPNIKYGDYFLILNRTILKVSEENPNKTKMDVSIAFKWHKKTWFEKIVCFEYVLDSNFDSVFYPSTC